MATDEIAGLLAPLRQREKEIIDRIVQWSNVNSGSDNAAGVTSMAALLYSEFGKIAPTVSLFSLPDAEELRDDGSRVQRPLGSGVRAVCRPEAPVRILLNGHLDTVFGPEHPFQRARREGARLVGPGVTDMKGGLAVMLESLRILEEAPFRDRLGWEVILTPDEEMGSPSSAEMLVAAAPRHQVGLIFEPALPDGSLVSGRLGSGNFLVRVEGRAAHAGRDFESGRSAVVALAELVLALHELNNESGIISNVGRITGGGPLNIVPAFASCRLNLRVASREKAIQAKDRIEGLAAEMNRREGFRVEVAGDFGRPPKPVTPALETLLAEFRTCAREVGFELAWRETGGGSDGNNLSAAGLPTVDSLGVRGEGIHTEAEFLEIESVVERISLCARFLLKTARGDIALPAW